MKYLCTFCNLFVYDEEEGDLTTGLAPGTKIGEIPEGWRCPVCGMPRDYLQPVRDEIFQIKRDAYAGSGREERSLLRYRDTARKMLTGFCGVYPICDGQPGKVCSGQKFGAPIGLGGAGQGQTFEANYLALQEYKLKMRVIKPHHDPEITRTIFGKELAAPVMGASLSGVKASLNDAVPEEAFYRGLLQGARSFGSIGMVGNTPTSPEDLGVRIVGENGGWGIPIFKPQSQERLIRLFRLAEELDVIAIGVDLEGAGSTFWITPEKQVFRKSEDDLLELVDCTDKPVLFKGIMSMEDAAIVLDSGAAACYVSNHGGRVLDCGQGVAEVLPDIAL
ncbi:MAG: alpha-hydroxy-acid oxidizing protein, partial [Methanomicrobiaceae archaeon]|nr:alpha-hydroxy-acid oxidizing protein [Methanomicrobiaceae archaeon]